MFNSSKLNAIRPNLLLLFNQYSKRVCNRGLGDAVKPVEVAIKSQDAAAVNPILNASSQQPPTSKLGDVHKVSNVEKHFLVWTKKFKSVDEVPAYVSRDMMERTRNILRIKLNLTMIAIAALGSVIAVWLGKQAQKRGESVVQHNLEWHKQFNTAQIKKEATNNNSE